MKQYKVIENNIEYTVEEYSNGTKFWYKHGKLHREDGPAREFGDGTRKYFFNDKWYKNINSDDEWIIFQIIT